MQDCFLSSSEHIYNKPVCHPRLVVVCPQEDDTGRLLFVATSAMISPEIVLEVGNRPASGVLWARNAIIMSLRKEHVRSSFYDS